MKVFRLCKSKHSRDLSGQGAEKSGGRWNSKGTAMLYTSASIALCTIEIAVHTPLGNIPADYSLSVIEIPDETDIEVINFSDLPAGWNSFPYPDFTQKIGDMFITGNRFLMMKVPSAAVQGEFNFLINPGHMDFSQITIFKTEPFLFDDRLFLRQIGY